MPYDIIIGRDEADKKRFGISGLIYIGKSWVRMGQYTSLSNPIYMDVARSHVVLVAGKRGSGKSYSLSVIAEELTSLPKETAQNIAPLMFDTMGIFWTMKFKNEKEKELLAEWNLKPKSLPIRIFVPFGYFDEYQKRRMPIDEKFALKPSELNVEDWVITFGLGIIDPVSIVIEDVVTEFKIRLKEKDVDFDILDIIRELEKRGIDEKTKSAAIGLFKAADTWGIFAKRNEKGTLINELVSAGKTSILDLSMYSSTGAFNVRALVIGLVTKKLFNERMLARKREEIQAIEHGIDYLAFKQEREMPLVWLFLDEGHEMLPQDGKTAATDALIQVLREGRQPGISLVLATQQPGQIHHDVMTQSDIVISHRVTSKQDISALNEIMQTYVLESIKKNLDDLSNLKGSAIILDDNSERIYPMRVRPKFTWHGGEAPIAVKVEKRV